MINKRILGLSLSTLLLAFTNISCQKDLADDEHYKPNAGQQMSAYQTMRSSGNYSIFLKGIDLTGFHGLVDGQSIITVMAPDDNAFKEYLEANGYSTIEEMNNKRPQFLKNLIGQHLMYYAYDWNKLVNFRPSEGDAASDEQKSINAGYYYKHRTRSQDEMENVSVKLTPNATEETKITVYHQERFLPVFSYELFNTKKIDAKSNYEYFYPGSTWTGDKGFNIANASVSNTENVVTSNGYLYNINKVIPPVETIYNTLKANANYSDFLKLYDKYSTYTPADEETNTKLGKVVYLHTHGDLPPIALEWPTTNYAQMDVLERVGYNVFAPSNKAIANFFTNYWTPGCGYDNLESLDGMILKYFIYQSFSKDNFIAFKDEIVNGTVTTPYDTPININPETVTDRVICENGTLYGMDNMEVPAIFSSVIGPAFKNRKYLDYLYALDGANLILSLSSNKSEYVTLIPDTAQFKASGMQLYTTTNGKELQQYSEDAGAYVKMSSGAEQNLVNIHSAINIAQLKTKGTQVIPTNIAFNYWFVNDGKITSNALFNKQLNSESTDDPFVSFTEITNNGNAWNNGRAYTYNSKEVFAPVSGDGLAYLLSISNDKRHPYYLFSQLLQKAGLTDKDNGGLAQSILDNEGTRFIVFIPTNEAIKKRIADIPGCSKLSVNEDLAIKGNISGTNKTLLAKYLRSYFITATMNVIASYPYIGSDCKGSFFTTGDYKMNIKDNGTKLSVSFIDAEKNNVVNVNEKYHYFPFAFKDGCFHLIDDILE